MLLGNDEKPRMQPISCFRQKAGGFAHPCLATGPAHAKVTLLPCLQPRPACCCNTSCSPGLSCFRLPTSRLLLAQKSASNANPLDSSIAPSLLWTDDMTPAFW